MEIFQRRLRHDAARQSDRVGGDAAVLVGGEIIRFYARCIDWVARAQPYKTAAGRPDVAYARGKGRERVQLLAKTVERQRLDVILQIGAFLVTIGAGE